MVEDKLELEFADSGRPSAQKADLEPCSSEQSADLRASEAVQSLASSFSESCSGRPSCTVQVPDYKGLTPACRSEIEARAFAAKESALAQSLID